MSKTLTPANPGSAITKANTITLRQVAELRAANHVAVIYPRKGEVVVDGFKRFRLAK